MKFKDHLEEINKTKELELAKQSSIFKTLKFRDWTIIPTAHSGAQALMRVPEYDLDDWKLIHLRMMDHILNNTIASGHYLFYSKSLEQGYVVDINVDNKKIKIVTILPKRRNNPKPGTEKILVENQYIDVQIIELF